MSIKFQKTEPRKHVPGWSSTRCSVFWLCRDPFYSSGSKHFTYIKVLFIMPFRHYFLIYKSDHLGLKAIWFLVNPCCLLVTTEFLNVLKLQNSHHQEVLLPLSSIIREKSAITDVLEIWLCTAESLPAEKQNAKYPQTKNFLSINLIPEVEKFHII